MSLSNKLAITGQFTDADIESKLKYRSQADRANAKTEAPKHFIPNHPGFELVKLPNGTIGKLAYKKIYDVNSNDLDIELLYIAKYEKDLTIDSKRKQAKQHLKFHYKKAISIISPKIAGGWNRWSEHILELFISEKLHKVIWGSGNCGKSIIMAVLLYTKWRVKPDKRMVVIASKTVTDASARVFGYIKDIHAKAPTSPQHDFQLTDSQNNKGIHCLIYNEESNKHIRDDRACIVSLPIKVSSKTEDIGGNLLGKHPDDELIIAFDEAQELPASMLSDKIFLNWYTNKKLHVYAWGNPQPVDFNAKEEHDMLFKLGASKLTLPVLKKKEKDAKKTTTWKWSDTAVLHLAMTDSPKDDPDERNYYVEREDGTKDLRLHFLAGADNVERIADKTSPNSPSWYSQVLGFPYLHLDHSRTSGVLTGYIVKVAKEYPLFWKTPTDQLEYFMGVDPAVSGRNDNASIVVGRKGLMMDGRIGVDLMKGEGCRQVKLIDGEDFVDTIVNTMYGLSQQYNVPLKNISIETHGVGDVLRYALQRHIENGKWGQDFQSGDIYHVVNPTVSPSDRRLFKTLGHMRPAKEIVMDCNTEYWLAVRCMFLIRQIFNVPDFILQQFYSRQLLQNANSTKYKIEPKSQMKKRGISSPNDADAMCNMIELIRLRGFKYRYFPGSKYNAFYGPEYDAKKERQKTDQALGVVSRMLELGENFNTSAGLKKRRALRAPIDSV